MPYRYPDEVIEEVRLRNDIVDVISSYVHLKKQGSNYFGLCPFHNEKSPSFSVSPSKQIFYCFGCGAGGNVFKFVQDYENYTFTEALKMLAERANIVLPEVTYSEEAKKKQDLKSEILRVNKEAGKFYYYQLRNESGTAAMQYLKNRGLTDETMQRFGLGFARTGQDLLYRYLKKQGFTDDVLKNCGIFTYDEKRGVTDKFWSRVIFPIMDVNHRIIGFGGRTMGDAKPKYLNSPETPVFDKGRNLYGLNHARTSRKKNIILCEGYMDVIAMHQAGFNQAVASLGTALTSGQANLLKRYTEDVLLCYDSDDAGTKAALRAIPILREAGISAHVISLSPYKDPDEFIKNLGAEEFEKRLEEAENPFYFEVRIAERSFNLNDPQGKTRFAEEIARMILRFEEAIERDNYIEGVAGKYGMNPDSLRKLVAKYAMKGDGIRIREPVKSGIHDRAKEDDGIKIAQRMLLTWFVEQPKIYPLVKPYLHADDFSPGVYRRIAQMLFEQLDAEKTDPAAIIGKFEEDAEIQEAAKVLQTPLPEGEKTADKERMLKELLINVRTGGLQERLQSGDADMDEVGTMILLKQETERLNNLTFHLDQID
ncbi:MAG: DNA primase [Lachnospiraceae bacterium]|nr:DNA primase [Lachnospiraceae bacterium]